MDFGSLGERLSAGVKARVLSTSLLSDADCWSILSSDSVGEVARKLQNTSYADAFRVLPAEPRRSDIEVALKTQYTAELTKFALRMLGSRRAFIRAMLVSIDAENLKTFIRNLRRGSMDRDSLRRRMIDAGSRALPYERVLACSDFGELADAITGTPFDRPIRALLRDLADGSETKLYNVETALDIWGMGELTRAANALDSGDRDSVYRLYGDMNDLRCLCVIYRARMYYRMRPEGALAMALPLAPKSRVRMLRDAAQADDPEQFTASISRRYPAYAQIFESARDEPHPMMSIERDIRRLACDRAAKMSSGGVPGFVSVLAYFVLKDAETSDMIRMVEAVRYGYDRRAALKLLIRRMASGGVS